MMVFTHTMTFLAASNLNQLAGVFRYNDESVSFDIGVVEISIRARNPNNDTKGEYDSSKVITTMHELLKDLTTRVRNNTTISRNLQVFGMVISGKLFVSLLLLLINLFRYRPANLSNAMGGFLLLCSQNLSHFYASTRVGTK